MKIEQNNKGLQGRTLARPSADVRMISGHAVAGLQFATMITPPAGSPQGRTLASRKPNTDPRRFVTHS